MKTNTITLILLFTLAYGCAQEFSGLSKTHKLDSKVFDTEREIRVFLPHSYSESQNQSYPTIYLFDAQFDPFFNMTNRLAEYMSQIGELNEYIIVGIKTINRPKEFTPMYTDERTKEGWGDNEIGKAALLEAHLKHEVFPLIEEQYRVHPFRLAIGHSLGGTFVLNSILTQPDFFQGVIAISPNVSYDYEQLVWRFDTYLKENNVLKKFVFISAGTIGNMENRFRKSAENLNRVIQYYNPKDLMYTYKVYEGQNHSTTPIFTISDGLLELAKIWIISEEKKEKLLNDSKTPFIEDLKLFYTQLSQWANYNVTPSIDEINTFGYDCLGADKILEALSVFDWALEIYPEDANLYDSKAEALQKHGNLKEAKIYFKKALEVLENTKNNYDLDTYNYYKGMFTDHLNALKTI